jgi:hypothetical protein
MNRAPQITASLMSIDLPRNSKGLHFTGSVKALAPERPANALGQQRPNAPPPPPPTRAIPKAGAGAASAAPVPVVISTPTRLTTMRGQVASMDEDIVTEALDRDALDAALFPVAKRESAAKPSPNLPVPHFRSVEEAKAHHATPVIIATKPAGGSLPLGVWLMAALVLGILSFNFAPDARSSLEEAVRALDSR